MAYSLLHKCYENVRKGMLTSDKVEITHTKEEGKDDYIINPKYYFDKWILDDETITFKTADHKEGKRLIRVIYPVRKHKDHEYFNSYNELRFLKDNKYKSGKICVECLNAIPEIKNDYAKRLACKSCCKGEVRKTINPIIKINHTS